MPKNARTESAGTTLRVASWALVTLAVSCQQCSGPGTPPAADGSVDAGSSADGGSDASAGDSGAADAGIPHVIVRDGGLWIDGRATFLFGGELQYFRVRDPAFDPARTQAAWAQSLDLMADAGMNLVSTYVPWDFHQPTDGGYDFTGARDLGAFLRMVCARGMFVVVKPGPLITAEWPFGFGSFGAVPIWWKQAHPETLVRTSSGSVWTFSPTGDATQAQPTYLHPTYLAAAREWLDQVAAVVRPFVGSCLVGLQVDNETNLYWGDRYKDVDYSAPALSYYQSWLAQKYGGVTALNSAYGTSYASFAAVVAPSATPQARADNVAGQDWYWAGQGYVAAYLAQIRSMLEAEGFHEPDLLFFTNDSPFALSTSGVLVRNVLLHDAATKDAFGIPSLDLYPKQTPLNSALQDQPFQADFFTALYDFHVDADAGARHFAYGAELQGGFYSLPVLGPPDVSAQATDQLLARTIGHGLKGAAFYVIRDGLNSDNSVYAYQAAISLDGGVTDRYLTLSRWGRFLQQYGADLELAQEIQSSVAVLIDGLYAPPEGGILDEMQLLQTGENPALWGWLQNAGFNPAVLDARSTSLEQLARYRVVFFQDPDFVPDDTARLLAAYQSGGGYLVHLLWPGRMDMSFQPTPAPLASLFPATAQGDWVWPNVARAGAFNASIGGFTGALTSEWYESFWSDSTGALQPFAWEQTQPSGANGRIVGYTAAGDGGPRAFLGTNVYSRFNRADYYGMAPAELQTLASVAQSLVDAGAEVPFLTTDRPRHLAWARRSSARLYLFVINDDGNDETVSIALPDLARLGLDGATSYHLTEGLSGSALGVSTGTALQANGIQVSVAALSTAVIVIAP
jgi:hypothetical protein